jgi:hypothetical protein
MDKQVNSCSTDITGEQKRSVLEDLIRRSCRAVRPSNIGLPAFEDWIRSLFPELYSRITDEEREQFKTANSLELERGRGTGRQP